MTPEEARQALESPPMRRGRPVVFSPEEVKRRAIATSRATTAAKTALCHLHPDDYRALYRAAIEKELGT